MNSGHLRKKGPQKVATRISIYIKTVSRVAKLPLTSICKHGIAGSLYHSQVSNCRGFDSISKKIANCVVAQTYETQIYRSQDSIYMKSQFGL